MSVVAADFEVVGAGPFGFGFDLVPAIDDVGHLDALVIPDEPPRHFVGPVTGVTFDLDRDEIHGASCFSLDSFMSHLQQRFVRNPCFAYRSLHEWR